MNYFLRKIKANIGWVLKNSLITRPLIRKIIKRLKDEKTSEMLEYLDSAEKVSVNHHNINLGIVKDDDEYSFNFKNSYWHKFERLAKNNHINYSFFNIHGENWLQDAEKYNLIVWRPASHPASLYEARTKIKLLEERLNVKCYPSSEELWFYEDKIRQFYMLQFYNLPVIPTYISFDESECYKKIVKLKYPIVSKSYVGSGSMGVSLIKNIRSAKKYVRNSFGKGINNGFPYYLQKDYVYFQSYVRNTGFDLRIILLGEKIFGYYRLNTKRDFRASGAGIIEKKELPLEAVFLAKRVKEKIPVRFLAVDLIKDEKDNSFLIIEISVFIGIETPEQLMVNNTPGYYILKNHVLQFHKGKFWLQELLLKELIEEVDKNNSLNG